VILSNFISTTHTKGFFFINNSFSKSLAVFSNQQLSSDDEEEKLPEYDWRIGSASGKKMQKLIHRKAGKP